MSQAPTTSTHAVVSADDGRSLVVAGAEGQELFTYHYLPSTPQLEAPRPYLHPLRTLQGSLVSSYRPHDHPWHRGLAWSLPHLGEHNLWGGPTYVTDQGYVQLPNNGSMDHVGDIDVTVDQRDGHEPRLRLSHSLRWHTEPQDGGPQGVELAQEERVLSVSVREGAWVLTHEATMTNTSGGDLPIGSPTTHGRDNAGYGGLFWRGPRDFTGGALVAPGASGADELRGSRAPWMGFTGRHDGSLSSSTLVIVNDPANPNGPNDLDSPEPQWFARSEEFAALCPAPFFSTEVAFAPGQTLRFRYAVVVADGEHRDSGAAALAALGSEQLGGA